MPAWLISIFILLFGLAFGSFLNVCISRLPRHESIVRPRSRCPKCRAEIRSRDNVPILSWVLLRGRCRACAWRIPWRYPAVEFATAAVFLLCFLRFGLSLYGVGMAALCFLLLGLAVMDAETMRLPDAFTLPGIVLGVVWSGLLWVAVRRLPPGAIGIGHTSTFDGRPPIWPEAAMTVVASTIWAVLAALLILAIRWLYLLSRRREGMGLGDAKLLAMIAAWLGPVLTLLTVFLGVVGAAMVGALWTARRGRQGAMAARLPFGSFLCAAAIYSIFAGEPLIRWYLQFFP
ncbi:MAG TPA: prepilin peptidase [Acidobacteriaceae bacterium]